jgi:hypothetical protein
MISLNFEERLQLFDLNNKVKVSSEQLILEERTEDGRASLVCELTNYSIAFLNADKSIVGYFKNQKCADAIIFQKIDKNNWKLIIIEFKKTLSIKSLGKSIEQFKGAIHNSLSLAGILGIKEFKCIEVYSAYRREKISSDKNENTVIQKDISIRKLIKQWENKQVVFDFINSSVYYGRIELDDLGEGSIQI